jgi:hypothetical protein
MTDKVVKRGYVKWEDENGFHKEPLSDHPELLAAASPREQLYAEEVKRQLEATPQPENDDEDIMETVEALRAAPEEIVSATQLTEAEPASAAEEPVSEENAVDSDHEEALRQLREKTSG